MLYQGNGIPLYVLLSLRLSYICVSDLCRTLLCRTCTYVGSIMASYVSCHVNSLRWFYISKRLCQPPRTQ